MRYSLVFVLATVTACGPFVSNTDRPSGLYVGGGAPVSGDFGVAMVDQAPEGGVQVEGISCRNKVWDPAPTDDSAIAVLRRETAEAGYNAVHLVSVERVSGAMLMNCWSAIRATGLAFNQ